MANAVGFGKQNFKGHTTKNTAGNPNLFNQDPAFAKQNGASTKNAYNSSNQHSAKPQQ